MFRKIITFTLIAAAFIAVMGTASYIVKQSTKQYGVADKVVQKEGVVPSLENSEIYDSQKVQSLLDLFIAAKREKYIVVLVTYPFSFDDLSSWRKTLASLDSDYTRAVLLNMDSETEGDYFLVVGPFQSKNDAEIARRYFSKKGWTTASVRKLGIVQVEMIFSKNNVIKAGQVHDIPWEARFNEELVPKNVIPYTWGIYDPETDSYPGVGSAVLYYRTISSY
jgi:hypothetical protein